MKTVAWIVFGLCSVFLLAASAFDVKRAWSIAFSNPYGFSYMKPGDATTPGIPHFVLALRATVPLVVSMGAVALSARRLLGTFASRNSPPFKGLERD
ncbi:MAG: hypothetical protein ABL898_01580 [Hyphomicrobiaceae bacterium]|nr:hypothetical protein [Hyphomicrobiaceae bacterium]